MGSLTGELAVAPGQRVRCGVHHIALVCPSCIGAVGGKARSAKKAKAARRNARRPRPGAVGKPKSRKAKSGSAE